MTTQTDIKRLQDWLQTYPGAVDLADWAVDYTDNLPGRFGTYPAGLQEISRIEDICGNVTVQNQYNFALYMTFAFSPGDDVAGLVNADWVMDFQRWVQTQSVAHKAPTFGNVDIMRERISAQNGALFEMKEDGAAMYMVQLEASFTTYFET